MYIPFTNTIKPGGFTMIHHPLPWRPEGNRMEFPVFSTWRITSVSCDSTMTVALVRFESSK